MPVFFRFARISKTTYPNDDVMFPHSGANGPESQTTRMFCRFRQVAPAGAKLLSTIAGLFENCD